MLSKEFLDRFPHGQKGRVPQMTSRVYRLQRSRTHVATPPHIHTFYDVHKDKLTFTMEATKRRSACRYDIKTNKCKCARLVCLMGFNCNFYFHLVRNFSSV